MTYFKSFKRLISSVFSGKMHICLSIHWNPIFEYSIFWTFDTDDLTFDKDLANVDIKCAGGSEERCITTEEYKSC